MKNILKSVMFVSWSPLLFYLSTRITGTRGALLFGNRFDLGNDRASILVFYVIYFVFLYFFVKKYDLHVKKMIDQKHQIIFHSAVLSLFIMLASVFIHPSFDLIFKLGVVWFLALIQYLLSHLNYSDAAKTLEDTSKPKSGEKSIAQYLAQSNQSRSKKNTRVTENASENNYAEISRNAKCPCGSGERYKHCCGKA